MQCSSMHAWWWCQMMWLMPKIFARPCCGGFIACLCARANDFAVCLMSSCSSIHARRPAGCYTRRAAALSAAPQPRRAFARIMHDWEGNWWAEWPSSSTISLCDGGRIPRHRCRERETYQHLVDHLPDRAWCGRRALGHRRQHPLSPGES